MKKGWVVGVVVLVGLIASAFFWGKSADPAKDPSGDKTEVTIAQTGDFLLYSVVYLAKDAGIFEKNGLDVEIVSVGGDENAVAAVIAGEAEFGVGDPTFAAIAKERGENVSVVSSVVNGVPFWGVTYSEDVANQYRATGLAGLSVATFPDPSTAYTLQEDMYSDLELEPSIVEGAFGSLIGILESGRADIALELEPNVSVTTAKGAQILYSFADMYGDFAITGLTVSDSYKNKNAETVGALVSSLQEAMDLAHSEPERAIELLTVRFPELDGSVIEESFGRMIAEGVVPNTAETTEAAWLKAVDLRIEVGDIKDREIALSALDNTWSVAR